MIIKREVQGQGFRYTSKDYNETQVVRVGYSPILKSTVWNLLNVCLSLKLVHEATKYVLFVYPLSEKHLPDTHPLKQSIRDYYHRVRGA